MAGGWGVKSIFASILCVRVYVRDSFYWAIQRSSFARVNVLRNLSRKKLQEVAAHFRADF